jgi:hypothetical protein
MLKAGDQALLSETLMLMKLKLSDINTDKAEKC